MGTRTDAARAEVVAARRELLREVGQLEAAGRSAVDVPGRVRRDPVRTAGLAAGAAFVVTGGPRRLYRQVKRFVLGPEAEMPKSMLPNEIDKELRKLGNDGERVRAVLEREFTAYLDEHAERREALRLRSLATLVVASFARPALQRAARQMAEQLIRPESGQFDTAVRRIRERREAGKGERPVAPEGTQPVREAGRPQR